MTPNEKMSSATNKSTDTPPTISLDEAQARMLAFRTQILGLSEYPSDARKTKACMISMTDINDLLAEPDLAGFRCYLSLKADTTGKRDIAFCIVGTRLDPATGEYIDVWENPDGSSAIYDFTMPCPNTCDATSPLNEF